MATSTIAVNTDTEEVTLINVFTVDPHRQGQLFEALDRATREIFVAVPGFISANLHLSLDGTRVVNYAQWASAAHYEASMKRGDVLEHITGAAALADSYDPTFVRVRSVHHR